MKIRLRLDDKKITKENEFKTKEIRLQAQHDSLVIPLVDSKRSCPLPLALPLAVSSDILVLYLTFRPHQAQCPDTKVPSASLGCPTGSRGGHPWLSNRNSHEPQTDLGLECGARAGKLCKACTSMCNSSPPILHSTEVGCYKAGV